MTFQLGVRVLYTTEGLLPALLLYFLLGDHKAHAIQLGKLTSHH